MQVFIPSARQAALNVFRRGNDADYERLDIIENRQLAAAQKIYSAVKSGCIAYIETKDRLVLCTRSIRHDDVQISYFWEKDGDYIATSHVDAHDAKKLLDTLQHGKSYIVEA
jgi:hypothetical protein